MKIGILGDTHDHLPALRQAVDVLNRSAGSLFLHTGDFVSPFTIPVLAGLSGTVVGVFGNNDGDRDLLKSRCSATQNVRIEGNFYTTEFEGIRIALIHGHETALLDALIGSGYFDLVVHGHTHQASVSYKGTTLIINPGEVCGYLTGSSTCALYDTQSRAGMIIPLSGE